jgi:hypothetical protein
MRTIIQRARVLINWVLAGAFGFILLGYLAKAIPAVSFGVALIALAINLFGIYLFIFYPGLREHVGFGLFAEALAWLVLWM